MSPLILAVDTTHEFGSLALARGDELLEEVPLHAAAGFAQILYGCLRELLARHGVAVRESISSRRRPGRALLPACGSAWPASRDWRRRCGSRRSGFRIWRPGVFRNGPLRAVVIDARRGEVYGAVYDPGGLVVPEIVAKLPVWLEALPQGVEFVSNDFTAFGRIGGTVAYHRSARIGRCRRSDRRDPRAAGSRGARCQLRQARGRRDGLEGVIHPRAGAGAFVSR